MSFYDVVLNIMLWVMLMLLGLIFFVILWEREKAILKPNIISEITTRAVQKGHGLKNENGNFITNNELYYIIYGE